MKTLILSLLFIFLLQNNSFSQNWDLVQPLASSDISPADNLGISVAISDEYLVTGAWFEDADNLPNGPISESGAAYIFKRNPNGTWQEIEKVNSLAPEALGYFGFSVAIDGNHFMVGAFNEDDLGVGTGNSGVVYVYEISSTGDVLPPQVIQAPNPANADYFGHTIAMSGDYLLIGAHNDNEDANENNFLDDAGAAYIFKKQTDGTWLQIQKIVASDRGEDDAFGKYLDIRGDKIIVGAHDNSDEANFLSEAGAAYIFEKTVDDQWVEVQKLLASDHGAFDSFGWDVAIDGDWALIGARDEANGPNGEIISNIGAAYFFHRDANGTWQEVQKIYSSDFSQNDLFGGAIDLDGSIAIIGAETEDEDADGNNFVNSAGSAYIFEKQANDTWAQVQKVVGENRGVSDLFGASVSVRGLQIGIGAWRSDGATSIIDGGATYIFQRDMPLSFKNIATDFKINLSPNPSLGRLVLENKNKENQALEISIFNLLREKIFVGNVLLENVWEQNFESFPNGVYLIQLKNEANQISTLKWVKQ